MKTILEDRAVRLRDEFDERFATPAASTREEFVDFLLVQVAAHRFALRLSQIAGLTRSLPVVSVPSGRTELLGLSSIRGTILSVYSMAKMLGLAEAPPSTSWLALSGNPDPIAVAFHELDGFVRVPSSSALQAPSSEEASRLTRGVLRVAAMARPIVDLRLMFDTIRRVAGRPGSARSGS